jgi:hypothetical protein
VRLRPEPTTDLAAAEWIVEGIGDFACGVQGLIPPVFDAYARLLHPAWSDGAPVTWATVAATTGRRMHRLVQFDSLAGTSRYAEGDREFEPDVGQVPDQLPAVFCDVLGEHTATPGRCWFCVWDGWGWVRGSTTFLFAHEGEHARVRLPQREYILLKGPLGAATEFDEGSPNIFWPDDRAWCAATEIDLDSTYIGGSSQLVEMLLADSRFETWPAEPGDRVDAGADRVNPSPIGALADP